MKLRSAAPLLGLIAAVPVAGRPAAANPAVGQRDLDAPASASETPTALPEVDVQDLGGGRLFVVASGDYTPETAMVKAAQDDPSLANSVKAILESRGALGTLESPDAPDAPTAFEGSSAAHPKAAKASSTPATVGYPVGDNRAWFIHRWITGSVCDGKGCTEVTRVDLNITTNPGAVTSKEQWSLLKQGPHLKDFRAGALANYGGADFGATYSSYRNSNGSGDLFVDNGSSRRGLTVRHYVTVQGTLSCDGIPGCTHPAQVEHRGATNWATCHTYDNVCTY